MKYSFALIGEDYTEFVWDCEASTREEAFALQEAVYPDARVDSCHDEYELRELEMHRYNRIAEEIDNGYY